MAAGDSNLTLRRLASILFRHRRAILVACALTFVLAVCWTIVSPKRYQSQAKLLVRLGRENATLDPTSTVGQGPAIAVPNSREEEINSVIEIVQSRPLPPMPVGPQANDPPPPPGYGRGAPGYPPEEAALPPPRSRDTTLIPG